jgi:hypothetical protein
MTGKVAASAAATPACRPILTTSASMAPVPWAPNVTTTAYRITICAELCSLGLVVWDSSWVVSSNVAIGGAAPTMLPIPRRAPSPVPGTQYHVVKPVLGALRGHARLGDVALVRGQVLGRRLPQVHGLLDVTH